MAELDNKSFELKVGIFIAIGILVFFITVFSIGDINFSTKGYQINIIFDFAAGITESAPVRLAGVNVGQIDRIDIFFDEVDRKTKVKVLARINGEDVRVEKDAKAIINTLGLLGEKYLEIFPGEDTENILKNNDILIGHSSIPTEMLKEKMSGILDSTSVVMTRLEKGEGTIGKLMTEDAVYNDLESFVSDIKKHPWKLLHKPRGAK